ncbi:hypothetical protein BBJ28_00008346, partial [Nothophytophthora sp. Chile5]
MLRLVTLALLLTAVKADDGHPRIQFGPEDFRDLDPSVQHIPLDPTQSMLRPPPPHVPNSFDIF